MDEKLREALRRFFSLPNWQNRIGPWKDVGDALMNVERAFKEEGMECRGSVDKVVRWAGTA